MGLRPNGSRINSLCDKLTVLKQTRHLVSTPINKPNSPLVACKSKNFRINYKPFIMCTHCSIMGGLKIGQVVAHLALGG